MIRDVYLWANGMVMVFGEDGNQLPRYQGRVAAVRARVLADAPAGAQWWYGDYQSGVLHGCGPVTREQWEAVSLAQGLQEGGIAGSRCSPPDPSAED